MALLLQVDLDPLILGPFGVHFRSPAAKALRGRRVPVVDGPGYAGVVPTLGLVFPRLRYPSGDFPLGIALLAAFVRERAPDWRVAVCDTTFDPRLGSVAEFLDREKPDVVGVALYTFGLGEGLAACRLAADRGIPVIAGGPHPTIDPGSIVAQESVAAVVLGEGELATLDLCRMLHAGERYPVDGAWVQLENGSVARGADRRPFPVLDELPLPAWDLIDMDAYVGAWGQLDSVRPGLRGANLNASRGCPFSCSFCQPVLDKMFGNKLRQRSPDSVVEEIKALKERYDIEGFWFNDDTFTTRRSWVEAFCDAMEASGLDLVWGCNTRANLVSPDLLHRMTRVGLRKLAIGLESATERIREGLYQKGVTATAVEMTVRAAKAEGVQTLLYLMLGSPGETRREMLTSIRFASSLPASEASFSLFVPIPGTSLHDRMVAKGYEMSQDHTDYDYYARQPFAHELSQRELRMIQRLGYAIFFGHPYRWASTARVLKSPAGRRSLGRKILRILPRRSTAAADWRATAAAAAVLNRDRAAK